MIKLARRIGLAIGAFVIAWLAVSLIAGWLIGPATAGNLIVWAVAAIVGAGVYLEILRRERVV